jgi:hypothetical protein
MVIVPFDPYEQDGSLPQKFATAKSSLPSPLKSPTATEVGRYPMVTGEPGALAKTAEAVALVMGKKTTLDAPPPGDGFTTVIEAVPAVAMSAAVMAAVNCVALTKVVVRALPFQSTVDAETNPVPFTVSVNPAPPGAAVSGTTG